MKGSEKPKSSVKKKQSFCHLSSTHTHGEYHKNKDVSGNEIYFNLSLIKHNTGTSANI